MYHHSNESSTRLDVKESSSSRSHSSSRHRDRDRSRDRDRERDRDRDRDRDREKDREKDRHRDRPREREREREREHRDNHHHHHHRESRERDRDHKDQSRERTVRDRERDKSRERDRDRDRDKSRDKDRDRERDREKERERRREREKARERERGSRGPTDTQVSLEKSLLDISLALESFNLDFGALTSDRPPRDRSLRADRTDRTDRHPPSASSNLPLSSLSANASAPSLLNASHRLDSAIDLPEASTTSSSASSSPSTRPASKVTNRMFRIVVEDAASPSDEVNLRNSLVPLDALNTSNDNTRNNLQEPLPLPTRSEQRQRRDRERREREHGPATSGDTPNERARDRDRMHSLRGTEADLDQDERRHRTGGERAPPPLPEKQQRPQSPTLVLGGGVDHDGSQGSYFGDLINKFGSSADQLTPSQATLPGTTTTAAAASLGTNAMTSLRPQRSREGRDASTEKLTPPPRRQAASSPSRASLNDGKDSSGQHQQAQAASAKFNGYLHSSTNNRAQPASSASSTSTTSVPATRAYAKRPPPVPTSDGHGPKSTQRTSSSSQHRILSSSSSPSVSSISSFDTEARPEPPPKDAARRAPSVQSNVSAAHPPLLTLDTHKPAEPITSFAEAVEATMGRYRSGSTSSSVPSVSSRTRSDSSLSQNPDHPRSLGRSHAHGSVSSITSYSSMANTAATTAAADPSPSSSVAYRSRHHHHHDSHHSSHHHSPSSRSTHGSSSSQSGSSGGHGQYPSQSSASPPISPYYEDQPKFSFGHLTNGHSNSSQSSLQHYSSQQQNGHHSSRHQKQQSGASSLGRSSSRSASQSTPTLHHYGYGTNSGSSGGHYAKQHGRLKPALVKTPIARARAREAGPPRKVFWGDKMTIVTIERPDTPPPPPPPDKKKKKKKVKKGGNPTGVNQDPEYDSDYYSQPYTPAPAEVVVTLAPWIGNPNFDEEQANSRYVYEDEYDDYDEYDEYYEDDGGQAYHQYNQYHHDLRMGPDDDDEDDDDEDDEDEDEEEEEDQTHNGVVWGKGIGGGKGFQKKKSGGMFKFKRAVNRFLRN